MTKEEHLALADAQLKEALERRQRAAEERDKEQFDQWQEQFKKGCCG